MSGHDANTGEGRDVFVEPYAIESHGHVGDFHSDAQRFSFCYCSCGWCGWSNDTPSATRMLDLWRQHVGSAEGVEWARADSGRADA